MVNPPNEQRRNEKSRRAILDAALELCTEKGYPAVTVEGIAARAGVSKKTIYRWWQSKGAVILEAVVDAADASTDFPDTGDIAADLHAQLSQVVRLFDDPRSGRPLRALLLIESHQDPGLAGQIRELLVDSRIERFNQRMRRAQQEGQVVADVDLDVVLDQFYGPIYHRLVLNMDLPDDDYLGKIVSYVLAGITRP
ncbi:TetR/AcrR family transcriptional regulator [Saccharopolyspora sp. NPDC000359]|uniref:TetR/AcrR family transcriptional regulator n=1 Tax=Saccharopolyspora sp. NPDC000359 TaxID=3154251 RepID=UPI003320D20F